MANSAKRKQVFILVLFVLIGAGLAFLAFRDIPAPIQEQRIEIDAASLTK